MPGGAKSRREKRKTDPTSKQRKSKRQRGDTDEDQVSISRKEMEELLELRKVKKAGSSNSNERGVTSGKKRAQSSTKRASARSKKAVSRRDLTPPFSEDEHEEDGPDESESPSEQDSESDDHASPGKRTQPAPNLGVSDDEEEEALPGKELTGCAEDIPDITGNDAVNNVAGAGESREPRTVQGEEVVQRTPASTALVKGQNSAANSCDIRSRTKPSSTVQQSSFRIGNDDLSRPVVEHITSLVPNHFDNDNSVLLTFMKSFEERITKHISQENTRLFGEMHRLSKENQTLREELADMYAVVCHTAQCVASKGQSASLKNNSLSKKLALLPVIFSTPILSHVIAKCSVGYCVRNMNKIQSTNSEIGINIILVLFFSRQPNERKRDAFTTTIGMEYSFYRKGIMLTALHAMQNNVFDTFLSLQSNTWVHIRKARMLPTFMKTSY